MGLIKKTEYSPFIMFAGGGINEFDDPIALKDNEFTEMVDVILEKGRMYKRPGRTPWGPTFDGDFKGVKEYIDDSGTARLLVANNANIFETTSTTKTSRLTVTDEDIRIQVQKSKAFINGATTQKKLSGATASDVGLAAPTEAAGVAAGAGTGLTGSYAWVYTFETADGLESDPAPTSNSLTLTNENASVTLPASPDARVTMRNVYRSVAGGSLYFYEGTVANNTDDAVFTSEILDAGLTDQVEDNHGQPQQATIAEGCNDRQFWAVGGRVFASELGRSAAYLEYSEIEFFTLPNGGACTGLKRLYNPNTGREDLYCFQNDSISFLPEGNPANALQTIRRDLGCSQHDTLCEWNGTIIFLSNQYSVCSIIGRRVYDISSQNIPTSLKRITDLTKCRAGVIFNNYYALTARTDATKLYNNAVYVCDLRTIQVLSDFTAQAKTAWTKWNIAAEYILQTSGGAVLAFDNSTNRIFSLSLASSQDTGLDSAKVNIPWYVRTKNFFGSSIYWLKQPRTVGLKGIYTKDIQIVPYYWADRRGGVSQTWSAKELFIVGQSVMGDNISSYPTLSEARIVPDAGGAANTFSFKFSSDSKDQLFELTGFQFTFKQFARGV